MRIQRLGLLLPGTPPQPGEPMPIHDAIEPGAVSAAGRQAQREQEQMQKLIEDRKKELEREEEERRRKEEDPRRLMTWRWAICFRQIFDRMN